MTMNEPNFLESLSIADGLARNFVGIFPTKGEKPNFQHYLRGYCIPGLRWLWRTGDANTRATLAARVAVWRGRKTEEVRALQSRILARELGRKGVN